MRYSFGFDSKAHSYFGEPLVAKVAAVSIVVGLTVLNCYSVKESTKVQNALTVLKLLLIVFLFVVSIAFFFLTDVDSGDGGKSSQGQGQGSTSLFEGSRSVKYFGSALVACLWSFDGWADLNFMQEELIDPVKSLPATVLTGLVTVLVAYILANVAYVSVLSYDQIVSSNAIGYEVGKVLDDAWGTSHCFSTIFALGVVMSTAGSLNGSIMTGGRGTLCIPYRTVLYFTDGCAI